MIYDFQLFKFSFFFQVPLAQMCLCWSRVGGGGTSRSAPLLFMYLFVTNYVQRNIVFQVYSKALNEEMQRKK